MNSPVEIEAKIGKFQVNLERLDGIINGPAAGDNSEVTTDSGLVPTVARKISEIGPGPEGPVGPVGPPPPIETVIEMPEVGEDGTIYVVEGGYISGPDGAPFIMGELGNVSDLPASAGDGEAFVIDGQLWVFDTGIPAWQNVGRVQGPPGPPVPMHIVASVPSTPAEGEVYLIEGEPIDVTGLEHGTAAQPSIAFRDNPGVGIFMPQTGTIGISTGGIERMRIDLNGNITLSGNVTMQSHHTVPGAESRNEYTESGTWQKPPQCKWVFVEGVGGGGAGNMNGNLRGGGGGTYASKLFRAEDVPNIVPFTVGIGGAGVRASGGASGGHGSESSFGDPALLVAPAGFSGGGIWGGDAGVGGPEGGNGGNAVNGGAGGGGSSSDGFAQGGTSLFGGNGGRGAVNFDGTDGEYPGGGGGAVRRTSGTHNTGSGGGGMIRVTTW